MTSLCLQNEYFVKYFDLGGGCSPLGPLTVHAWKCALSIAVGSFVGEGDSVNGGDGEHCTRTYWVGWAGYVAHKT